MADMKNKKEILHHKGMIFYYSRRGGAGPLFTMCHVTLLEIKVKIGSHLEMFYIKYHDLQNLFSNKYLTTVQYYEWL